MQCNVVSAACLSLLLIPVHVLGSYYYAFALHCAEHNIFRGLARMLYPWIVRLPGHGVETLVRDAGGLRTSRAFVGAHLFIFKLLSAKLRVCIQSKIRGVSLPQPALKPVNTSSRACIQEPMESTCRVPCCTVSEGGVEVSTARLT